MSEQTYPEILKEALALEKACRWSAASDAWRRAALALGGRRTVPSHVIRYAGHPTRVANRERLELSGLKAGDELRHVKHGTVKATCIYHGPTAFEYAGETYASLTGAARAAAADLGLVVKSVTGWVFWGVEATRSTCAPEGEKEAA